jgi:hypothetical protein
MNTKGKTAIKESKTRISAAALMRLAGLSAVLAGLSIIIMGLFHPENDPAYVTTPTWIIVHIFATSLGFFGVLGLAGLYARQAEKVGWLGLVGFLLFSGWMALQMPFSFLEAAVLPHLASEYPQFVAGFLGMFNGTPSPVNLGILPTLWNISTPMLILGVLLFAIATYRARVLPRWAAGLLALGCVMIPVGAIVPHDLQAKIILIPIGLGVAWMGYALLAERRAKFAEAVLNQRTANSEPSKVI